VSSRRQALRFGAAPTAGERPFLLAEGLEVLLSDAIEEPFEAAAVGDGAADGVVEVRGDVGADLPARGAVVEIESGMPLAALAAARGLATGPLPQDERAAEDGFVGEDLSGARACLALGGGALSPRSHGGLLF
jgi:hypothetical protein